MAMTTFLLLSGILIPLAKPVLPNARRFSSKGRRIGSKGMNTPMGAPLAYKFRSNKE
jgi:hypothetical protein